MINNIKAAFMYLSLEDRALELCNLIGQIDNLKSAENLILWIRELAEVLEQIEYLKFQRRNQDVN